MAVCVLREELLSDEEPKFYVSIQNSKKFLQKNPKNEKILSFREIFFAETYVQIVFLAHQSLHSFVFWKSTFHSRSTQEVRKWVKIQNVSSRKSMLEKTFR